MTSSAQLLKGKHFASAIKEDVRKETANLISEHGISPKLVVVRVGEDPASEVYVNSKVRTAEELGIVSEHKHFDDQLTEDELLEVIGDLNDDDDVDGILVQLPLPEGIDQLTILDSISPAKDVDGFHPYNVGRLSQGCDALAPCTPAGVIDMLKRAEIELLGVDAVVVGKSNIVGKPMAQLLMNEGATVTVCHSKTKHLERHCAAADLIVAAAGVPGLIRKEHIKEGAVVVDVGINVLSDESAAEGFFPAELVEKRKKIIRKKGSTLVGDVNFKDAMENASYYTPVPGGVGLLTVAMLMRNTVDAAKARRF